MAKAKKYVGWIRRRRIWRPVSWSPDEAVCHYELDLEPDADWKGRPFSKVVLLEGVHPIGREEAKK